MENTTSNTSDKIINESIIQNQDICKAIIENSLNGIYIIQNDRIKYCNQKFADLFGYQEIDDLYDKSIFDLISPKYLDKVKEELKLKKLKKKTFSNYTVKGLKKDGAFFYFEVFSQLIKFATADATQGTIIDVTEKKHYQDKLLESQERMKELVLTKEKFYSIIAHDLKNPFNSIIGFSNLLIEELNEMDNSEIMEVVKMINKTGVETMNLLINLLDWSRSQSGTLKINPKLFDINEIIELNLQLLYSQAANKNIEIYTNIPEPTIVYADKNMVNTIIRNLISNAIKYTHKNGEIEINAELGKSDVKISVVDNGVGISDEIKTKLFNFNQDDTMLGTNNEKGTGLGLLICKELIEHSKGKIWIKSDIGKGSEFSFTLPANN